MLKLTSIRIGDIEHIRCIEQYIHYLEEVTLAAEDFLEKVSPWQDTPSTERLEKAKANIVDFVNKNQDKLRGDK